MVDDSWQNILIQLPTPIYQWVPIRGVFKLQLRPKNDIHHMVLEPITYTRIFAPLANL